MTVTFHALWMLCALGAVVWAAAIRPSVRESASFALGFAAAALLTSASNPPDAVWVGGLATVAAAAYLFKPGLRLLAVAVGGALGGWWTALLEAQALPAAVAVLVAGAVIAGTMRLARTRAAFAPEQLIDEGMLAVGVVGLGVAVLPGVLDGWNAATNLSGMSAGPADAARHVQAIPMWTLVLLLMCASLGALFASWSRR